MPLKQGGILDMIIVSRLHHNRGLSEGLDSNLHHYKDSIFLTPRKRSSPLTKGATAMTEITQGADYAQLLAEVKERVRSAQYAALKAVNTELVGLYWDIGRMIAER